MLSAPEPFAGVARADRDRLWAVVHAAWPGAELRWAHFGRYAGAVWLAVLLRQSGRRIWAADVFASWRWELSSDVRQNHYLTAELHRGARTVDDPTALYAWCAEQELRIRPTFVMRLLRRALCEIDSAPPEGLLCRT